MEDKSQKSRKTGLLNRWPALLAVLAAAAAALFGLFGNHQTPAPDLTAGDTVAVVTDGPETAAPQTETAAGAPETEAAAPAEQRRLTFSSEKALKEHFKKHGAEMGFQSADAYLAAANRVVNDPAALFKYEAEDGDEIYYLEETNEIVFVSKRGFIRTYFSPRRGIAYFNDQ